MARASSYSQNSGDLLGQELSSAVIAFHDAIASDLGLSSTEWRCLRILSQTTAATAGRLAAETGLTTGAITGIVDRLERAGYVRREPNPKDRRSVLIRPLRQQELLDRVAPTFASLGGAMAKLASRYTTDQLAAISTYLKETVAILKEQTEKLKSVRRSG